MGDVMGEYTEAQQATSVASRALELPPEPATLAVTATLPRAQLVDLERQLISSLVTVQRALGKEPTVTTRAQRRERQR